MEPIVGVIAMFVGCFIAWALADYIDDKELERATRLDIRGRLVAEKGFHKAHIVEAWLRQWFAARGENPDEWETLKTPYRAEIQADAEIARAENPRCLLDSFAELLPTFPRPLCITAIRFINEHSSGSS
jgi:hypothetical protein